MPRRREYASDAERVRAWRERKAQVEAERWAEINTLRDLVGTDDPVLSDAVDALAQANGYAPLRQNDDAVTLAFNAGRQEGYGDGYEDGYKDAQAGRPKKDVR
jgi:hypothetical protein